MSESEPSEKRRKLNGDIKEETEGGSWVFVGNLPPSSVSYGPPDIEQWFVQKLIPILKEAEPDAAMPSEDSIVTAVTNFNSDEGCCFVKLHSYKTALLSLRLSGSTFKGSSLSVTLVQCLPDPVYQSFPVHCTTQVPPLVDRYLDKWRGRYIVFSDLPHNTTEYDIRSLFEALGGPLESLFLYTENGFFKGCGRLSLVNSLVNESVVQPFQHASGHVPAVPVQRLHGVPIGQGALKVASLLPDNRPRPLNPPSALLTAGEVKPVLSVSAQVLMDPVIGLQVRSGRQMGATPSRVVQLLNIVKLEDLLCEKMHEELIEDVRREASQYGKLESVVAPTPVNRLGRLPVDTGCGKIFLEFADTTAARKAQFELNGRLFDNRVVCASFYPLKPFLLKQYDLMMP